MSDFLLPADRNRPDDSLSEQAGPKVWNGAAPAGTATIAGGSTGPSVTVVVAAYNAEKFIQETLESVAAQSLEINSIGPFKAGALHPAGGTCIFSGQKIEQAARCLDQSHASQPVAMADGERLLGRRAETEPENVRSSAVDGVDDALFVSLPPQIAAAVSDNIEIGVKRSDTLHSLVDHRIGRAEQEHARAALLRQPSDVMKEVGGCDPFRKRRLVEKVRDKNQRHAVRVNQVGCKKKIADPRLPGAQREHLTIGRGEDKRALSGATALERNVDHQLRGPAAIDHRDG
jgi:hypothetical protein